MVQRYVFPQTTEISNVGDPPSTDLSGAVTVNYLNNAINNNAGLLLDTAAIWANAGVPSGTIILTTGIPAGTPSQMTVQTTGVAGTETAIKQFIDNYGITENFRLVGFTDQLFTVNSTVANTGTVTLNLGITPTFATAVPSGTILQLQSAPAAYTRFRDIVLGNNITGTITNNVQARPTLTLNATVMQLGSAIDLGASYVGDNVGSLVRVTSTNPTVSNVAGSLAVVDDFGAINVTSTPWPPTIPAGYNTNFLVVEAADFTWSGVGVIQTTPSNGLTQIAWIRKPTVAAGTLFTNLRVWVVTNSVGANWVGSSVADATSRNPVTVLTFPDLTLGSITQTSDSFGSSAAVVAVVPTVNNQIALKIGATGSGTSGYVPGNVSSVTLGFGNMGTTWTVVQGQYAAAYAFMQSQGATPPAGDAAGNWTLPSYLLFISNLLNPTSSQFGQVTVITTNPVNSFLQITFTGNQPYFANLGLGAQPLFIAKDRFTFVPVAQTEVLRLVAANTVNSLNSLQGAVNIVPGTNIEVSTSGQNITITSVGGGTGGTVIPVIEFTGSATGGANQTFTNVTLMAYAGPDYISVTVNGSTLNRSNYSLSATVLTINAYLSPNANVQVQPSGGGGSATNGWQIGGNSFPDNNTKLFGSITNNRVSLLSQNTEVARLDAGFSATTFNTNLRTPISSDFIGYWNQSNGQWGAFAGTSVSDSLYYSSTGPMGFSATGVTLPQPGIYCGVQWTSTRMVFATSSGGTNTYVSILVQDVGSTSSFSQVNINCGTLTFIPSFISDLDFSPDGTKLAFVVVANTGSSPYVFTVNNFTVTSATVSANQFAFPNNVNPSSVQWLDNTNIAATDRAADCWLVNTVTGSVTNTLNNPLGSAVIESTYINNNLYIMTGTGFYLVNRTNPIAWTEDLQLTFSSSQDWGTEDVLTNPNGNGTFYAGQQDVSSPILQINIAGEFLVTNSGLVLGDKANFYGGIYAANSPTPTGLTQGQPGQSFVSSGNGPAYWGAPALPFLAYYPNTDQTIAVGGTVVWFSLPYSESDIAANFGTMSSNNGIFTFSRAGFYLITYSWNISIAPDGWGIVSGGSYRVLQHEGDLKGSATEIVEVDTVGKTFSITENNGGTLTGGGTTFSRLQIMQIG